MENRIADRLALAYYALSSPVEVSFVKGIQPPNPDYTLIWTRQNYPKSSIHLGGAPRGSGPPGRPPKERRQAPTRSMYFRPCPAWLPCHRRRSALRSDHSLLAPCLTSLHPTGPPTGRLTHGARNHGATGLIAMGIPSGCLSFANKHRAKLGSV